MALGTEVDLGPATLWYMGTPLPLLQKEAEPPTFQRMCIVAKRQDG